MPLLLCLLTIALALYDLRTRRVPNSVTLLLLLAGITLHAPGTFETWLATALLFVFWHFGALGGGDAKLWMALLWLAPPEVAHPAFFALFGVIFLTAIGQLLWRKGRGLPLTGHKTPGAWRAIPFAIWLVIVTGGYQV